MTPNQACAITMACCALSAAPTATAQPGNDRVATRVVAERATAAPGGAVRLAMVFDIDPGWHLYWRNPGDTGVPPTIDLTLPEGVEAGAFRWPAPERYIHAGGELLDYIHEDRLTLVAPLHIDADIEPGTTLTIKADVEFLVCREACIPGWSAESVTLIVGEAEEAVSAERAIFEAFDAAAPAPASAAKERGVTTAWTGRMLEIAAPNAVALTFYPDEPRIGGPIDPMTSCIAEGDRLLIEYGKTASDAGRVTGVLEVEGGDAAGRYEIEVPPPPAG